MDDGQWYAYCAGRVATHRKATRHAVDHVAHLCGAVDLECGRNGIKSLVFMGPWDPENPYNCMACTAALAGIPGSTN